MIEIDQEPDVVPARPIRWSAIIVAAGIAIGVVATILLEGPAPARVESVVRARPQQIEATPFQLATEAEQQRAAADRRLDSYGWVDRGAGTIHVPLDVAIEHYLGGAR